MFLRLEIKYFEVKIKSGKIAWLKRIQIIEKGYYWLKKIQRDSSYNRQISHLPIVLNSINWLIFIYWKKA